MKSKIKIRKRDLEKQKENELADERMTLRAGYYNTDFRTYLR